MSTPLFPYQQVRHFVLEQIATEKWKEGELIPSEIKLAAELSVHRLTVNRVLTELARDGLLIRRRGVGTTLTGQKPTPKPQKNRNLVGLICGHHFDPVSNPYYGVIFEKMRKILKSHGLYLLPLGNAEEYFANHPESANPSDDLSAIAMLGPTENDHTINMLQNCGCPAIIIGVSEYQGTLPHINTADYADAQQIAEKLFALGHQNIVHINSIPPKRIHTRLAGFLYGCEQAGHSIPYRYILEAKGLEIRDGKAAMQEFLETGLPFTAVFGAIDNLALGAMSALLENGISIPEQVSIVGFDGVEASLHGSPKLATMCVSRMAMAERAAQSLTNLCLGYPANIHHPPLYSTWFEGETLGPPPSLQ